MERSEIRMPTTDANGTIPDCASLHPGYALHVADTISSEFISRS
jgi:hypothetical protein